MGKYVCKRCGKEKAMEEFPIKQKKKLITGKIKEYRNCLCQSCRNIKSTEYRNKDPHGWIRTRYNVDDATARYWYERSMTSCEICGVMWQEGMERLCIDHDHSSGKVRGILCKHCNHVLGHSREQVTILDNAKAYLISHREN